MTLIQETGITFDAESARFRSRRSGRFVSAREVQLRLNTARAVRRFPRLLPPARPLSLTESEFRALVVESARSLLDMRYRHQGRLHEGRGLDCLGVLLAVAAMHGFEFEDDASYSMDPNGYYLIEKLSEHMDELPHWRSALPGDVLCVRWHISRPPQHCGIVTELAGDDVRCVHSSRRSRKVVENAWANTDQITHAFRIRELSKIMEVARG